MTDRDTPSSSSPALPPLTLPPEDQRDDDSLFASFLDRVSARDLELYPAQEEAIMALYEGANVILATPTGSGKSLVAEALHYKSYAQGRRSIYTCPIKALVNEKFFALCREFGAENVGMITGDAAVNAQAPILCCTAEILANMALREGGGARIDDVIMDEFHYYSDRDRGVAWQVPLLTMPQTRFLLMSATIGDTEFFEQEMTRVNGRRSLTVRSNQRPVPLEFVYSETPLHETIRDLVARGKAPIYLVSFTQRETAELAQALLSEDFCTKDEKRAIAEELSGVKFSSPFGKDLQKLLKHGVGIHHAGLLPKYRLLVERLAQKGMLKIISGTDTLGVGVNVPIRTVLMTKLCKFDGEKTTILSVRDFQQIAGRAGRKGYDNQGTVVAQAPEHVIENLTMERKAASDPKKKKFVRKKPPEKGYVHWSKETFDKLVNGTPEPLQSRFQISHGMLITVLSRGRAGCRAMKNMIRECHDGAGAKREHRRVGFQMFRSLVERNLIEFRREGDGLAELRVNADLQEDFSLMHALALYLIDTMKRIDPYDPEYPLRVLTLCESIIENPDLILRRQLDAVKTRKMGEMKAAGMEYEERMAELEKLEYPKPDRDFIYDTFNEFAAVHPWIGQENIRPKSIAREMYETFQSFDEYVREYDLKRNEGTLLRYLSETYKVLSQTVPEYYRNEDIADMMLYFETIIRQVDSSLLDEWARLRDPSAKRDVNALEAALKEDDTALFFDVTRDVKGFTVLVRNAVFRLVRALSMRQLRHALEIVEPEKPEGGLWTEKDLAERLLAHAETHAEILTDREARGTVHTRIETRGEAGEGVWQVSQVLVDPEGANDWQVRLAVDIAASREASRPVMKLLAIEAL